MAWWKAACDFFLSIGTDFGLKGTLGKVVSGITAFINVSTLVVGVKGFLQARQMQQQGQAILANKTAAGGKVPVVYGTRRVGSQIIYMDTPNNDSRDLYVVYALSVG